MHWNKLMWTEVWSRRGFLQMKCCFHCQMILNIFVILRIFAHLLPSGGWAGPVFSESLQTHGNIFQGLLICCVFYFTQNSNKYIYLCVSVEQFLSVIFFRRVIQKHLSFSRCFLVFSSTPPSAGRNLLQLMKNQIMYRLKKCIQYKMNQMRTE